MEIKFSDKTIKLSKELNVIDQFAIDSAKLLEKHFDYVIVSGYLPILFGKPRGTEDIDVFIRKTDLKTFKSFHKDLVRKGFEIFNAESVKDAFDMLKNNIALRIARKGNYAPNIELKFPIDKWGERALKDKLKIILNRNKLFISTIEMNIAFKLHMGSRKDIDDACHLYLLFKKLNHLDIDKIVALCIELGADPKELERCKKYE